MVGSPADLRRAIGKDAGDGVTVHLASTHQAARADAAGAADAKVVNVLSPR